MRRVAAVIAGACCTLVIACAAGSKPSVPPSPAAAPEAMPAGAAPGDALVDKLRGEIEMLDREIDAALTGLGVQPAAPAACAAAATCAAVSPSPLELPPAAADPTCKPGPSETCQDSCRLSDSICGNADRICKLAQDLGGTDAYANEKCDKGNTSCKLARERCCGCV